jgi:peptidyl-prolyl cis-trans isomerase C
MLPKATIAQARHRRHPCQPAFRMLGMLGLLGLALGMGACKPRQPSAAVPAPEVLATVAGRNLTAADFRYWWETRHPGADTPALRTEVLERMIERTALAEAARQAGLDRDPAIASQIDALLIARLQETRLQARLDALTVSDEDLQTRYEAAKQSAFTQPESTRVAVLWFNTRGQLPLEARYRPRLEQARTQVLQNAAVYPVDAGFGPLAIGNTEHRASRLTGGDLGWLDAGPSSDPFRTTVMEVAAALKQPGEVSAVVTAPSGLFLIRLLERRDPTVKPLSTVGPELRQKLLEERRQALRDEFACEILAQTAIERFPKPLESLSNLPAAPALPPASFGPFPSTH